MVAWDEIAQQDDSMYFEKCLYETKTPEIGVDLASHPRRCFEYGAGAGKLTITYGYAALPR